jgi:tetratricopeptide (TPR) repeat protein
VGDLYIKVGKVPEAVEAYERAANLYTEYGFPNNAIALCNKVLRNAPARTHMYLKLAMLMVERGFVAEAKQNLLEYADRMQKSGKTDEAFRALKEFADLSPDNEEIRLLLAEQLKGAARTTEAREQLSKLFHEAEASGDKRRSRATLMQIRAIDPDFDPTKAPKPKLKERKEKSSELVFLELDDEYRTGTSAAAAVEEVEEEVEPAAPPPAVPARGDLGMLEPFEVGVTDAEDGEGEAAPPPALEIEPTALTEDEEGENGPEVGALEGLDVQREFEVDDNEPAVGPLDFAQTMLGDMVEETEDAEVEETEGGAPEGPLVETPAFDIDETEAIEFDVGEALGAAAIEVPDLDLDGFDMAETEVVEPAAEVDEPLAVAPEPVVVAGPNLSALESAVADDPDDPDRHVSLGEALLETGNRDRGLEELDIALKLFEGRDEWIRAAGMADEIVRLEPNSVRHHQKRVELAYRSGEKPRLTDAYVGLGDALVRTGVLERARLVYQRVLEHDPDSVLAREALANLEPAPGQAPPPAGPDKAPAPAGGDYVDLGALILEDEPDRDTRMRVQDEEPTGDEEKDFQEMLAQFKRGIEANIEEEDWQAHYDLGVAFKEMGLLDESIAEFQKALRSPAGRMRTAEALGVCFYEKGQFSVASTVMRRAVETDPSGDESKIGLLYWLGRCEEEMKRVAEALAFYQRVFALDIRFQDVRERVKRLTGSGH